MANAKICKQCGKLKPVDTFRAYYGNRKGTYNMCRDCERVNTREKYLRKKSEDGTISPMEDAELEKIHTLYTAQRAAGLQPPRSQMRSKSIMADLDAMLELYGMTADCMSPGDIAETADLISRGALPTKAPATQLPDYIPAELQVWLTKKLTEPPEYYQDTVYEELREKYRPVKEIDQKTMMPVYDDTYKSILNDILTRFDDYEDGYDYGDESNE